MQDGEVVPDELEQLDALVEHRAPRPGQAGPVGDRGSALAGQRRQRAGDLVEGETDLLGDPDEGDAA